MAYGYKNRKNRRVNPKRYSKRAWYNKKYSAGDLAMYAWRGVKYLKGLVNSEKYHLDTAISTAASSTATVTHLTAVAQGDNDPGRTGNSIFIRRVTLNSIFAMNANAETSYLRLVLLRDKQQVGDTAPTWADVFESTTVPTLLNHLTLGRYDILYSKIFTFTKGGIESRNIKFSLNMKSHVRYNGTASSDIQKNGLYLMYLSNEATNTMGVQGNIRVQYHDN